MADITCYRRGLYSKYASPDGRNTRLQKLWVAVTVLCVQQRDGGRSFVLGERLQYVLLPGTRTQDEAAEDPLTAVLVGQQADFELYWKNKLLRPLSELFAVCLNPSQLHTLLSGPPHLTCYLSYSPVVPQLHACPFTRLVQILVGVAPVNDLLDLTTSD